MSLAIVKSLAVAGLIYLMVACTLVFSCRAESGLLHNVL